MYRKFTSFLIMLLLLVTFKATHSMAHDPELFGNDKAHGLDYIENQGQWEEAAKYKAEIPGGAVFITDRGLVYNFRSEADMARIHKLTCGKVVEGLPEANVNEEIINYHAYKLNFVKSRKPHYRTEGKRSYYHNYFIGNDSNKWGGQVGLFEKVIQQNIYEGIDLAIYSTGNALKYDFMVSPGADPQQIILSFEGVTPEITNEGHLRIKTTVNEVLEQRPYTYQIVNGKELIVECRYHLKDGILTFDLPKGYDPQYPLIIDPVLVYSTYSGGQGGTKLAYATTYDINGNLYAGANANTVGWPTTTGAYQVIHAGGDSEVGINKYNTTGTALLYSTYYGGAGMDIVHAMITNEYEELVVVGTTSSVNLPVTAGCYDNTFNGGEGDMFIARFNNTGSSLLSATFIGGSDFDAYRYPVMSFGTTSPMEVILDETGNIWVAGNTHSNNFPVSSNAIQTSIAGGYDGIVFCMNGDCSQLIYSTYLGGSANDACFNIVLNHAGNIVVCGTTESNNFHSTAGTLNNSFLGFQDGFVSVINSQTGLLMQSTYLGTNDLDQAYFLQIDESDNVLVLGCSLGNYPISTGVYNIPNGDIFIDKLSPNLSQSLLSTRIGNPQRGARFTPAAFLYDICGKIYMSGFNAATGLPTTLDAYEASARSFWFSVLEGNFTNLTYASYFGTTYDDHNHSGIHRFDPQGIVYQGICSSSSAFPTTPGVIFPVKQNSGVETLSFKFDFESEGVHADFVLPQGVNDSICEVPYTISFINTSTPATFTWDFGDGSPLSKDTNGVHTYTAPGVYTVTLYVHNDSTCNKYDTAYKTIVFLVAHEPDITVQDIITCNYGEALNIEVIINNPTPNNTILWKPENGIIGADNTPVITVNPFIHTTYYVTVWDTIPGICGRSVTDTIHIDIPFANLLPEVNIRSSCKGAANGLAWIMTAPSDTTTYFYTWRSNSDITVLSITDSLTGIAPGNYNVHITTTGCDTILHFYLPEENYKASFESDTIICEGDTVQFENTSESHFDTWYWSFGDNDTITQEQPTHTYTQSGQYNVMLVGIGTICTDTVYKTLIVDEPVTDLAFVTDKENICTGESITFRPLTDHTTVGLHWYIEEGTWVVTPNTPIQHAYEKAGIIGVTLTAHFRACPEASFTDTITVYPLPGIYLGPDSLLCLTGAPVFLTNLFVNEPGYYYHLWSTGDTVQTLTVTHPGTYYLMLTNIHGCTGTETIEVNKDCYIDIPNAFTPNGDGVNDYFFPRQLLSKSIQSFRMQVFNRWGESIFETANIQGRGWDGKFNDKEQPLGVYIYLIEAMLDNGRQERYEGNITLLR